jgi:hypothetical protein
MFKGLTILTRHRAGGLPRCHFLAYIIHLRARAVRVVVTKYEKDVRNKEILFFIIK